MRKLMWFTIGFGASAALGAYCFRGTGLLILIAAALVMAVLAVFFRRYPVAACCGLVLLGAAIGAGVFYTYDTAYISQARMMDGKVTEIILRADSYGWETDYGTSVDGRIRLEGRTYQVRLYLDEELVISPGDEIRTAVKLRLTDEGGHKEPTFHRSNGILLLAYQRAEAMLIHHALTWRDYPGVIRERSLDVLRRYMPEDVLGFAEALLLAYKVDLSYEAGADFRLTGISHIVAVSGLHMSILFALVYTVCGKHRLLTAILGIPCVILFAAITGFTPSVTRAAIMQILMMLALVANREYDPPTALAAAVLGMLLWNPLMITAVAFQLSVASVAGIYLFAAPIRGWLMVRLSGKGTKGKWGNRLARWISASVSVTLSATVLTTPLVAWYYGTVSLVNVLTNLLVLPVISAVFYGTMAVCALGFFWPAAAAFLGAVVAIPVRYVLWIASLLADFPLAAVFTVSPYVVIWLAVSYVMILWVIFSKKRRPLIAICCSVLSLCVSLMLSYAEPLLDQGRVTALDVGQGQCIVLQSGENTFLVDCGGDYPEDAADIAADYLMSMGINRIDGLILTHYDRDHAGGVRFLVNRLQIDRVYLPDAADSDGELSGVLLSTVGSEHIWLQEDIQISLDGGKITIYAPEGGNSGNESCAAVLFQTENCDTLITGDMSAFRERQLVWRAELPDLEVLVVGHHGSKTSTSQELLNWCAPDVAIISVGADNSYGHPSPEVLRRLTELGCVIYRTDQMGNIIYRG